MACARCLFLSPHPRVLPSHGVSKAGPCCWSSQAAALQRFPATGSPSAQCSPSHGKSASELTSAEKISQQLHHAGPPGEGLTVVMLTFRITHVVYDYRRR